MRQDALSQGQFRLYLLYGAIPFALVGMLTFTTLTSRFRAR